MTNADQEPAEQDHVEYGQQEMISEIVLRFGSTPLRVRVLLINQSVRYVDLRQLDGSGDERRWAHTLRLTPEMFELLVPGCSKEHDVRTVLHVDDGRTTRSSER